MQIRYMKWINAILIQLFLVFKTTNIGLSQRLDSQVSVTRGRFQRILDEFWSWRLEQVPEFATSLGMRQYDSRLEIFTEDAFRKRKEKCREFLRLVDLVDQLHLKSSDATTLRILREDLKTYVNGYQWIYYGSFNPINSLEGAHKDFTYWIDSMRFDNEESFSNYISRLRALVSQIREQINLMREAVKYGLTYHSISIVPVIDILRSMSSSAVQSQFYKPFNDSLEFIGTSSAKAERIKTEGVNVIHDHVLPAYKQLLAFIVQDYLPRSRRHESISTLSGGKEYYNAVLRWYTSSDLGASSLQVAGKQAVERIHSVMNDVRERVGYPGHLEDFIKHANGANKFFFKTEQELLDEYQDIVHNKIPSNLSKLFFNVKITSIQVQSMPFDGPTGVLMPGSDDGFYPAVFFVNIKNPLKTPKWQMVVAALRETVPGRHLQACYAQNQSFPEFRRWREFRKTYAVPFQFPFNTAYSEGWAMYAEYLGTELNLLTSPFEQFGQLHSELYSACLMVVDTGIHFVGWSKEEGMQYLIREAGVHRARAEEDVEKLITTPGRAVAPYFGYSKIRQLRHLAEKTLGYRFDIRSFHHQILRLGPVQLDILEDEISRWLKSMTNSSQILNSYCFLLYTLYSVILTFYIYVIR